MFVYRGAHTNPFCIVQSINSRYGIPALFFTTNLNLARAYARHYAHTLNLNSGGYVHQYSLPENLAVHNFNFKSSNCPVFRNLIYHLKHSRQPAVIITNVLDYPSDSLRLADFSDLIVVFSFSLISGQQLIESNLN